jgi:phosphate transport system permease protein
MQQTVFSPQLLENVRKKRVSNTLFNLLFLGASSISFITIMVIVGSLIYESTFFFSHVSLVEFFTGTEWTVLFVEKKFGVLPLLTATALTSAIALLVAVPAGLATAIYLSEYARPSLRRPVKSIIELLAGVPTVVYGYFALYFITPNLLKPAHTRNKHTQRLAVGLMIGVLIIPIVASLSEDAIYAVPEDFRQAAYALGARKIDVVFRVIVPAALSGIFASIILAFTRAMGETMIAAIAGGFRVIFSTDPREAMQTMTSFIAQVATGDAPHGHSGIPVDFRRRPTPLNHNPCIQPGGYSGGEEMADTLLESSQRFTRRDRLKKTLDTLAPVFLSIGVFIGVATVAALLLTVVTSGAHRLTPTLLTDYPHPNPAQAGMRSAILGTIWTVGLSALICIPLGIASALYLTEWSENRFVKRFLELNMANLAGVPSVVFGLVGLSILTYGLGWGRSIIAGAFTLAVMTLPLVTVAAAEAVKTIPEALKHGAYALGATKLQVTRYIILPKALPMMMTGAILAVSRAIGEAAPILVISGLLFIRQDPTSIFDRFTVMPLQIYNWVSRPQVAFQELSSASILVLLLILLTMNAAAIALRYRYQRRLTL